MSQTRPDTRDGGGRAGSTALGEWRRRRLTAAGFEPRVAAELADEPAVDLHELLVLLDRGCPPPLAARILAPLDADGPRC
jgi:hypothetical protein